MLCPCSPRWNDGDSALFSRSAVAGLTTTALSHVSFVNGLGSSCSQPLFANRPSMTHGSLRKETSTDWGLPIAESVGAGGAESDAESDPGTTLMDSGENAVPGI